MNCQLCPEKQACDLLGDNFECPYSFSKEIPFSQLKGDILNLESTGVVFCGSPDHRFKREIREKVALSNLNVKSIAAVTLLSSTDYPFSILEVKEITGLSERQLFYLKSKVK